MCPQYNLYFTLAPEANSTLDNIQFDGVNFDSSFLKPFYGSSDDFLFAGKFKGDDADLLRDAGIADIED